MFFGSRERGGGERLSLFFSFRVPLFGSKNSHLLLFPSPLLSPPLVPHPRQDPDVHVKNLKPSPLASPLVDRCIECGFCESNCPSRDAALTPRQRITRYREIARLRARGAGSFGPGGEGVFLFYRRRCRPVARSLRRVGGGGRTGKRRERREEGRAK